ncbi:hypothetical protein Q7P35_002482 [Cladosporium inversicolor]
MKLTCLLPVAALFTVVAAEPIPARGALVKKDEDCETNATTSSFEVDPTSSSRPTGGHGGYGGFRPPYGHGGYGTGSWGVPSPSASVTSGSPIGPSNSTSSSSAPFGTGSVVTVTTTSISISFTSNPRSGTDSTSSTEGSPVGPSNSTSTTVVTQTITESRSSSVSGSIVPVTNSNSPSGRPTGYQPPPYGWFPVPSGVDSSTEGSPATVSGPLSPAFPTPCNETAPPNTAPTAPTTTVATTITLPLTLTTTLTNSQITIVTVSNTTSASGTSPPFSIPSEPRGGNDTSSAPCTGTSALPVSPITATGVTSSASGWTGVHTGYRPVPYPYGPFPPFPVSSRPRSGTESLPAYGTGSSFPVGPTGASSSLSVTRNVTISIGTTYTISLPAPTGGSSSSTEGSPATPSSFSNSTSPVSPTAVTTSQTTSTGTLTVKIPGIKTITGTETFTLDTTITISGSGSSSTEVGPATSSIPLSTGATTSSRPGPAPYPYQPWTPSAPASSSTEVGPATGSSSIPLSTGASSSTEGSPIGPSNSTSSIPGTGTAPTPYLPFTPSVSVSSSTEGDAATPPASESTSAFTTITITPRTTLTSVTATNTPYLPSSAARYPGGYGGPPPGYGEGYRPEERQGWFGGWGRAVGNW